jgi:hypothetical protein
MFDGDGPMSQWPGTVGIVTVLMCVDISEFLCVSGRLGSAALVLFQAVAYQLILKILNLVTSVESPTVALFHFRYCAKLPSDTFTRLTPLWNVEVVNNDNGQVSYMCTVRLPINSPVKQDIAV